MYNNEINFELLDLYLYYAAEEELINQEETDEINRLISESDLQNQEGFVLSLLDLLEQIP